MKLRILFLGTSPFAVPTLDALHKHHHIIAVVTQPDKPTGRKQVLGISPIKKRSLELGLKIFQPENAADIIKLVPEPFDFLITASYGKILPAAVLKMPKKDALNVHASLLPKYRGPTPIQTALLNGDLETGVTIVRMAGKVDTGEVFAQEKISIPKDMMYPWLEKEGAALGARLLIDTLSRYNEITPRPQESRSASYCKKFAKEAGRIDWQNETAEQIFNKYRAFDAWPGIFTFYKGKMLKLVDIGLLEIDPGIPAGTVFFKTSPRIEAQFLIAESVKEAETMVFVKTLKGSVALFTVQQEGKKKMSLSDFVRGHQDFIGTKL